MWYHYWGQVNLLDELLRLLPNHPLEHLPHRPAGRTLGSRDILSHEATFLSPGCHPGSLV